MTDDPFARAPLFRGVDPHSLQALRARAAERRYAAGAVVYAAGGAAHGLHVVLEGRLRLTRAAGGRQHVVRTVGPGDTTGEVPLFAGGTYPATAVAAEPTRCLVIARDAVLAAVAADPALALAVIGHLAARLRGFIDRVDGLAAHTATGRLAGYLLARLGARADATRADAAGRPPGRPAVVTLGGSQAAVAEELGTVREVVGRGLQALVRAGAVRALGGGRYEVLDADALRALAEA